MVMTMMYNSQDDYDVRRKGDCVVGSVYGAEQVRHRSVIQQSIASTSDC